MKLQPIFWRSGAALLALFVFSLGAVAEANDWRPGLQEKIDRIDEAFSGDLGVYIRHLGTGEEIAHNTDQAWYLASTTKLPLAIVLMQQAEKEGLDLEQKLTLRDADYVDGTGDLLWVDPGARYSLEELNRRSIVDSDSTATDMLIRFLGEELLNAEVARLVPEGLGPITTILQVRYDAYSEVHPSVSVLTNRDFIDLKTAHTYKARYEMLLEKLNITTSEAEAGSVREAFERYYQRGINSGSLKAYGVLMEQLARGDLLTPEHTEQLLGYLSEITTGDHRIAGGLPAGTPFAHKTGTQVARSCDIGLLNPQVPDEAVIVAACARNYQALAEAEMAYQALGRALDESGLAGEL